MPNANPPQFLRRRCEMKYTEGGGKFWEACATDTYVVTYWGMLGKPGQCQINLCPDFRAGVNMIVKKAREKVRKGYAEVLYPSTYPREVPDWMFRAKGIQAPAAQSAPFTPRRSAEVVMPMMGAQNWVPIGPADKVSKKRSRKDEPISNTLPRRKVVI
jgi:predicted DNA-binding WGR domain protein